MPGDDLMAVSHQRKELLIPINDAFLHSVNKAERTINVTLPEGFLAVYTDEN
jgi:16S rRNA processing protein RimM